MRFPSNSHLRADQHIVNGQSTKDKEHNKITFGTLLLFSFNLHETIPDIGEGISTEMQFITDESFFTAKKTIDRSTLNTEVSKNRFRKGDFCCVSIYNNEIVSYCWIAIQRAYIGEIDKNIHMKSNEIYMYDAFTKPEFRGNNLFPSILTTILDFGRQKGYQKGLIFTLSSNNSSITAIKKAGFNRFQSVYFLDVNTKTRCRYGKTRNGETSIEDRLVQ